MQRKMAINGEKWMATGSGDGEGQKTEVDETKREEIKVQAKNMK